MKKCIILLLIFIAFFYTIRSITCPTCIGLPKKGERPFFEHGKIEYIHNNSSQPSDEKLDSRAESVEDEEYT